MNQEMCKRDAARLNKEAAEKKSSLKRKDIESREESIKIANDTIYNLN